jgi:cadmium resistance protein CadD (predicted permease)
MPYFLSLDAEVVAISIPILAVCGGVLIAITSIIVNGRKKEQEHRERLIAMEKGLTLPATTAPEVERPKFSNRRANGLVMTGIGLALTIALFVVGEEAGVWGLVPLFIGIGLLVAGAIDKREYDEKQRAEHDKRISA